MRLDENLIQQAKAEAARRGKTLTSLIEEGLRLVLVQSTRPLPASKVRLPICKQGGGTLPGVDLDDSASLLDLMVEGR